MAWNKERMNEDPDSSEEAYRDMLSEIGSGDCVTITANDEVMFCGKSLGKIGREFSEKYVWRVIREAMEGAQFWPNIYRINDHGNVSLLTARGKEVMAWV